VPFDASPGTPANRDLIRSYLRSTLPEAFRAESTVEAVLDRSGGVFLYAAHLAHARASGIFPDVADLPEAREFYPAYLARLRDRAGAALFESIHRPTLALLAAARRPATSRQLHRWGVPPGRLQFALFDLADFLQVHRQPAWNDSLDDEYRENRYAIAHEAFVRLLREHERCWWVDAHATIARTSLPPPGSTWAELRAEDIGEAQFYDLRFVPDHLQEAGQDEDLSALREDEGYASLCWGVGHRAWNLQRSLIALDLHDRALIVYEYLVQVRGRAELANDLANALMNKGNALQGQGRLGEAVECYERAIAIRDDLVHRRGRAELSDDLARALVNRALVLEKPSRWEEALACYDDAIPLSEACVQAGMTHLAGSLLRIIRYRMMTLLELRRWEGADGDVVRLLGHAIPILQDGSPPESVMTEVGEMPRLIRGLSEADRAALDVALGEDAEAVRSWVDD
jgi:tetratricopeptide (TPR) repeat protein